MTQVSASPYGTLLLITQSNLPKELDGSQGNNRGTGRQQIEANTDWDAMNAWLSQYEAGSKTYLAYEKEVKRFAVWTVVTLNKPLSSLVYEDWQQYREFLKDPQPAALWQGGKRPRRGADGRISKDYRPFAGKLKDASIRYAQGIIWSMFEWLRSVNYLAGNPIIITRSCKKKPQRSQQRYLTDAHWKSVLEAIEVIKEQHPARYARWRWMATLFYATGLRTSEALTSTMGDFFVLRDPDSHQSRHFLRVIGKGDKERNVPIHPALLPELRAYRESCGYSPWPVPGENKPLIRSMKDPTGIRPLTRQSIYAAFKEIFELTAERIRPTDPVAAEQLLRASTHWMRHTAATHLLNQGADLRTVQSVLGHENLATLSIYSHTEDLRTHRDLDKISGNTLTQFSI